MIRNGSFQDAGASPGAAAGWALRSLCAREAIAGFTPGDSVEGFERWTQWAGALDAVAHAPFAPTGVLETFEAWPVALFAFELTGGLVAGTALEAFESAWWTGAPAFTWGVVTQVPSSFGGSPQELFSAWRPGEVYALAFAATALVAAVFKAGALELFDGAEWTTRNTTLG